MNLAQRLCLWRARCQARGADEALYRVAGQPVALADGYVPLLLDYTHEDRAAKGLRAFVADQQKGPPVYFSAAQLVDEAPLLLLHGPAGSGKSTLARHLLRHLARDEAVLPVYHQVTAPVTLSSLLAEEGGLALAALEAGYTVTLIIDGAEHWQAETFFNQAAPYVMAFPRLRMLLLGRSEPCREWGLAAQWQRHGLLPLQAEQRRAFIAQRWPALAESFAARGDAHLLSRPAAFALALGVGDAPGELALAERGARAAGDTTLLRSRYVQDLLSVGRWRGADGQVLAAHLRREPQRWAEPLLYLAQERLRAGVPVDDLISALPAAGAAGVLLACALHQQVPAPSAAARQTLLAALRAVVETAREPLASRVSAAQWLARWGDPRDLQALVEVPAGTLTLGSLRHANSAPVGQMPMAAYRIGRYPVCNRDYLAFVAATGRPWRSEQGRLPERANAPAVDLTWHDAMAYCAWLTAQWRAQGRIAATDTVCLPSEPQWEYAARGPQPESVEADVYPWAGPWAPDHGNGEEAALNDTCAVGLFPAGRSPWGCDDLCGQVWEWTTTLWGEDMATPRFAYPYAEDGREAPDAPAEVRRVLRGGCFSSPAWKACCTYRGSLEPEGYWRGNGFRVVVNAG